MVQITIGATPHTRHGDCDVPHSYPENQALSKWVSKQRQHYKLYIRGGDRTCSMTEERVRLLDEIGFDWRHAAPAAGTGAGAAAAAIDAGAIEEAAAELPAEGAVAAPQRGQRRSKRIREAVPAWEGQPPTAVVKGN